MSIINGCRPYNDNSTVSQLNVRDRLILQAEYYWERDKQIPLYLAAEMIEAGFNVQIEEDAFWNDVDPQDDPTINN